MSDEQEPYINPKDLEQPEFGDQVDDQEVLRRRTFASSKIEENQRIIRNEIDLQLSNLRSMSTSEKTTQKIAVLQAAKDLVNAKPEEKEQKTVQLQAIIQKNPKYNESFFRSQTERLVYRAVEFTGLKAPEQANSTKIQVLDSKIKKNATLIALQSHLNTFKDKIKIVNGKPTSDDPKALAKFMVLNAAISAVKSGNTEDLQKTIKQYPKYNEAFFASTTEKLVKQAINVSKLSDEVKEVEKYDFKMK